MEEALGPFICPTQNSSMERKVGPANPKKANTQLKMAKAFTSHFTKKVSRYSISYKNHRKMQIKTKRRYTPQNGYNEGCLVAPTLAMKWSNWDTHCRWECTQYNPPENCFLPRPKPMTQQFHTWHLLQKNISKYMFARRHR